MSAFAKSGHSNYQKIGLSQQAVAKIEAGETAQPRRLRNIADLGNVTVAELLEPRKTYNLSRQKQKMLKMFRSLAPMHQDKVMNWMAVELRS